MRKTIVSVCAVWFVLTVAVNAQITLKQVQKAFKDAKLSMIDYTVFDARSDPNKMIGRPFGYLEKATWYDGRLTEKTSQNECTVEVFKTAAEAKKRKDYIDSTMSALPFLIQYSYLRKNVLVRVSKELDPAQAAEYEAALKKL